jgi:hypothetical protein
MSGVRDESRGGRMDGKWGKWAWMSGKGCGTSGFPEAAFQAPKQVYIQERLECKYSCTLFYLKSLSEKQNKTKHNFMFL